MSEKPSITDVVQQSDKLQAVIQELLERHFLLPGIFSPLAYLRDTKKIKTAWKRKKTKLSSIAMGVSLYNDLFMETINARLSGDDPTPSDETIRSLRAWEAETSKHFPDEYDEIESICGTLGQYLEFMNRKAQGF